jgi:hypothetical protein
VRVYIRHARSVLGPNGKGYCAKGMRQFAARHNLDFDTFAREGVDAEVLLNTGDAMAEAIVREAEKEEQNG